MPSHPRRAARWCAIVLAAVAGLLVAAPAALGHATLLSTDPSNDAVVPASPGRVTLTFSEPVETAFGAARVLDEDGDRVDDGRVHRPDDRSLAVDVPSDLAKGTYTVAWRAVSADSHPVSGAFVFHVGAPGAHPEGLGLAALRQDGSGAAGTVFGAVRFLAFATLLLAVGAVGVGGVALRDAGAAIRRRLARAAAATAGVLAVAALGLIALQGAVASGEGLSAALRPGLWADVVDTRFGRVWLAAALAAAALAGTCLALRRSAERWPRPAAGCAVVLAAALATAPALAGHASVSGPLTVTADVAHVLAASAWVGGLTVVLAGLVMAGGSRWELAARAVPRFSAIAVGAVAVLIAAGTLGAIEHVGAWRGLWDTTYGRLLLVKIGLLVPLVALGVVNHRTVVPRLRAGVASAVARRRFLRATGAELTLFIGVVAVTAALVAEPPARAQVAPTGPYATVAPLGPLELNLVVDPARAGANDIHLYLNEQTGQPAAVDEIHLSASLASRGIGPLRVPARAIAPGHYGAYGVGLAIPGDWQLRVEARRGDFDLFTGTVSVPIRKDS